MSRITSVDPRHYLAEVAWSLEQERSQCPLLARSLSLTLRAVSSARASEPWCSLPTRFVRDSSLADISQNQWVPPTTPNYSAKKKLSPLFLAGNHSAFGIRHSHSTHLLSSPPSPSSINASLFSSSLVSCSRLIPSIFAHSSATANNASHCSDAVYCTSSI